MKKEQFGPICFVCGVRIKKVGYTGIYIAFGVISTKYRLKREKTKKPDFVDFKILDF
jgi:hypothetical protein